MILTEIATRVCQFITKLKFNIIFFLLVTTMIINKCTVRPLLANISYKWIYNLL